MLPLYRANQFLTNLSFAAFDVAHWNKIDGRNDLCVATLPYATNSLDLNTYMGVREEELDDAALNAPPDEVKLIRENRIAAQLAQAMGRIRLRTMTKGDGTCEPCDIFLRLPNWRLMVNAERILDAVKRTLPGAAVVPWERASNKLKHTPLPQTARKGWPPHSSPMRAGGRRTARQTSRTSGPR